MEEQIVRFAILHSMLFKKDDRLNHQKRPIHQNVAFQNWHFKCFVAANLGLAKNSKTFVLIINNSRANNARVLANDVVLLDIKEQT